MSSDSASSDLWRAPFAPGHPLDASITIPGSKSMMARALILAALSNSSTKIVRPLISRDSELMRDGLRALGVKIEESSDGTSWLVTPAPLSRKLSQPAHIKVGNAGTVMRFLPPVAAMFEGEIHFDGDARSHERPIAPVIKALEHLGVKVEHEGRYAIPFTIHGTGQLRGGEIEIDASLSSQFISSLLLVAPAMKEGISIRQVGPSLPSLPHIEMTIAMLREHGALVESGRESGNWWWRVAPMDVAPMKLEPSTEDASENGSPSTWARALEIEPDLSNAAPFLAAALLVGGRVEIKNWPLKTTQPGDALREIFAAMGGTFSRTESGLVMTSSRASSTSNPIKGNPIHGIDMDLSDVGELSPTIAAVAAFASTPSLLRGIGHLRLHETDRLAALATELRKVGAKVEEGPDYLRIEPAVQLPTGPITIATYDDHRIATLGALVGLMIEGTLVENIATTRKTITDFPALWSELLGERVRS